MLNPSAITDEHFDNYSAPTRPTHIELSHWEEWLQSGVAPELIENNIRSLAGTTPYEYLCYSERLERTNTGRLVSHLLRQYAHAELGGWWCSGVDPLTGEPMLWGCFKPDRPRLDPQQRKKIKYEHPPKTPTRAFFLNPTDRIWLEVAIRYGVPAAYTGGQLHRFVNDGTTTRFRDSFEFWQWVLAHPELPIILVEGAKKAACLLSLGYIAIALPGIFNGRRVMRDEFGQVYAESLIPDLELFATGGRRFYFCFDRDPKPKTIKNVNLAILKTGKLLEQFGCDVQVITLPGPEKGVDDFIVAQGEAALAQVYANALPLASWQWHLRQQAELTYTPWLQLNTPELDRVQLLIAQRQSDELEEDWRANLGGLDAEVSSAYRSPFRPQKVRVDEYLLPSLKLDEPQAQQLPNGGIIVIASGKGTGKTKLIGRMVQGFDQVIAAGHRIALMRNLCARMGLDYKGDVDRVNGDFITGSAYTLRLGLCVDSLLSINPSKFAGCVLVIDEFMQVFTHLLTSSTCNKDGKRAALLARLHWLIRVASWVIVADADAADAGIDYIRALRGEDSPVYLIRNDYQPQGYPVRFIEATEDDAIVAELLEDIRAGLNVFVATDAKRGSQALKKLVETLKDTSIQASQAQLVLINSDTSGGEYEVDFIRNINERVTDADIVIATPSMATGVSIEVNHFDKVYGLFYGTVTDADASQALSRVRANVPRVVWCAKTGKNFSKVGKSVYPLALKQALKTRWEAEIAVIRTSLKPDMIPALSEFDWDTNPHLDLWAKLTAKTNASMWNLRANLLERLRYEGNQVEVISLDNNSQLKGAMRSARDEVRAEYHSQIAQAKLLNKSELTALERQESLKPEDLRAIEKTQIADFYCEENVTPELVAFDNDGKRRGQIVELEVLLYGSELSTKRDLDALKRQLKWGQGVLPFDQSCYELRRLAREVLGLPQFLVPGREWTDADLESLGSRARACSQQIKLFFGFSIPDDPQRATNIWIFRRLLSQLGVKTKARRQKRQQLRSVWIDEEAWSFMLSILERRQAKREAQATKTSLEALANVSPVVSESDVVTPPYINKLEGVTTSEPEILTPQDIQTGVALLDLIAKTEAVEELESFNNNWTPQQKRQLWQVVPQWLKEKIRQLIDRLRGHTGASGTQLDLGLT